MKLRSILLLSAFATLAALPGLGRAEDLEKLQVFRSGYPRAYFFRTAEAMAANPRIDYPSWEACFSRLMGIEGKCLDEEVPGRSRNIEPFTRFKRQHPQQLVLLHYNGRSRDPRFQTEKFFAGHWVYCNGATVLADIPAEEGETEIRIDDLQLFRTGIGRYRNSNDDIGLCELDDAGKPDWTRCEQVQLLEVDARRKVIRVRRGCYGTKPRAFAANRAYAAAHASEGPWGRNSNLLWFYNYATTCPRDAAGLQCADVHAKELAARFLPQGELAAFDGLEFDVLMHSVGPDQRGRGPDCNADGDMDLGEIDGRNVYGIGVVEFCRMLRGRMGEDRLIMADGMDPANQRAFGILNGIESEGWPDLGDWEIEDWSGGLNRHEFWQSNGRPPLFNYVNHKFVTRGDDPGETLTPDVPFSVHRLVLAAAMFTDSAVCYSFAPPPEPGERFGIWDELRQGTGHKLGWLGQPAGPAVHLATEQPTLLELDATSSRWTDGRIVGKAVEIAADGERLRISAAEGNRGPLQFRLRDVPCDGPDLFVSITAEAAPMIDYPEEIARLAWVGIARPEGELVARDMPTTGMRVRGGEETEIAADRGAWVRWLPRREFAGEEHDAYLVHPPYQDGVGYTFWRREVEVPQGGRLEFFTAMGEKSPERSDGIVFRVEIAAAASDKAAPWEPIFEHTQKAAEWIRHEVPLARWAGKRVVLKFVSDCGPNDNAVTDHSHWGDVRVIGSDTAGERTEPVRFMTWLNQTAFTSTFYFSDVRSKKVDLECSIESGEPVWIRSIRVYAHPDAMYRRFEGGLVLANPSPRPYPFPLDTIAPGERFRRLEGSSQQDPVTNDGSPVAGKVVLQPKEGLFLIKH